MTNNTHTDNRLSLNIEFDAPYWNSLTTEQQAAIISDMHSILGNHFGAVKKLDTVFTGKTWAISEVEDDRVVWERQSDTHGTIYVEFAHTLRWQAYSVEGPLTESADSGIIASGQTAEEVMDLIDAGWDN